MPTNILRKSQEGPAPAGPKRSSSRPRRVAIKVGAVTIRAELLQTPTSERIWAQLPLFSTAETWGSAIHFETPVETGRERAARSLAKPGEIYFWSEEDRVLIAFGPTPISRSGESRLPSPCNVWAKALDDLAPLKDVVPGEKVVMTAA